MKSADARLEPTSDTQECPFPGAGNERVTTNPVTSAVDSPDESGTTAMPTSRKRLVLSALRRLQRSVELKRGRITGSLINIIGWSIIIVVCCCLSGYLKTVGVAAAELLVPLIIGAALALTGIVCSGIPQRLSRTVHAMLGVMMGGYLQLNAWQSVTLAAAPLIVVNAATVLCCGLAALWLFRTAKLPLAEAVLSMVPGGSGGIIVCAHELGADSRRVALAQYLRVGLIALIAPVIIAVTCDRNPASQVGWISFSNWVQQPRGASSVLVLVAICLLGIRLGERIRLPAPVLLGPMIVAGLVTATSTWSGYAPAGPLKALIFAVVGLEVGLRFTWPAVRSVTAVLPRLLIAILTICLVSAGMAWVIAELTGLVFIDAYLASTPGGINAILAVAVSSGGDVALISTTQSLRLVLVLVLVPPMVRWIGKRT